MKACRRNRGDESRIVLRNADAILLQNSALLYPVQALWTQLVVSEAPKQFAHDNVRPRPGIPHHAPQHRVSRGLAHVAPHDRHHRRPRQRHIPPIHNRAHGRRIAGTLPVVPARLGSLQTLQIQHRGRILLHCHNPGVQCATHPSKAPRQIGVVPRDAGYGGHGLAHQRTTSRAHHQDGDAMDLDIHGVFQVVLVLQYGIESYAPRAF
mmetsp:Transcript_20931/g.50407  ORF Transcript_20931/g.50407 Transcript_20931/m.50407 type:complete len:208 (-) Transcript_20931:762-1385(-)